MGREIRRVPPNWEHPRYTSENRPAGNRNPVQWMGQYIPMHDQAFAAAAREWQDQLLMWQEGKHPDYQDGVFYWEYEGDPPAREDYRPDFAEEPTWYQVYQTISEGTPVTPPFATEEELIDYLATVGEFPNSVHPVAIPVPREQAERFVKAGSVSSFVITGRALLETYQTA